MSRPPILLTTALLAALAAGCGGGSADGLAHQTVYGTVTLDGQPLADGMISFLPAGGGPVTGGPISGGSYKLSRDAGPLPGSYRIEIMSQQPTGRRVPDLDGVEGATMEEITNIIPRQYNLESTLKADIKAVADNQLNFELKSK